MYYHPNAAGAVIRRLREQRKLTEEVLSGLCALSRSHLSEIESGRRDIRLSTLWRIAEALDVSPGQLIRMVEEELRGG